MIVWALFDSGNGCYKQVADKMDDVEIYSIGIDKLNKNEHFINLNLADYSYMFGDNQMFDSLDKLPKPDLIIASPPCESWSIASAMDRGNASWKQERGDALFEPQKPLSRFTIRDYKDYEGYQFNPKKSLLNRINGELCTINTIEIINRYNPEFYVIENPALSRIWEYIEKIIGFSIPYDNLTYYNNYNYPIVKATKFKSNVDLRLKKERIPAESDWGQFSRDYNVRSNIPLKLVEDIFTKIKGVIPSQTNTELKR